MALMVCLAVTGVIFISCNDDINVKKAYAFHLETMPVQKRIVEGQTAEIRCRLVREGIYDGARYTIRYFQPDGKGELRLERGEPFTPNDRYLLTSDEFRLYYTSQCDDAQQIDIYIEDNMGQVEKTSFSFQNETKEDTKILFQ